MEYRLVEPNVEMVKFIKDGEYVLKLGVLEARLLIKDDSFKII